MPHKQCLLLSYIAILSLALFQRTIINLEDLTVIKIWIDLALFLQNMELMKRNAGHLQEVLGVLISPQPFHLWGTGSLNEWRFKHFAEQWVVTSSLLVSTWISGQILFLKGEKKQSVGIPRPKGFSWKALTKFWKAEYKIFLKGL